MQPQILPLTQQEKMLQQILMGMQGISVKGESAALLTNMQETVGSLLRSVIVQIEVGKQMAKQKMEEDRIQEETKAALGLQTAELKNSNGTQSESTGSH